MFIKQRVEETVSALAQYPESISKPAISGTFIYRFFFGWLERMAKWCNHYVDEVVGGSAAASAGTLRHGVFYAVCQALLLAFSFRFREVVKQEGVFYCILVYAFFALCFLASVQIFLIFFH